jgi:hypothetical protein
MFISAAVNTVQREVRLNVTAVCDEVLRILEVVKPSTRSWDNRTESIWKHCVKITRWNGALRYRVHLMAILVLCFVKTSLTRFVPSSYQRVEAAFKPKSFFGHRVVCVQWLTLPDTHTHTHTRAYECIIRISVCTYKHTSMPALPKRGPDCDPCGGAPQFVVHSKKRGLTYWYINVSLGEKLKRSNFIQFYSLLKSNQTHYSVNFNNFKTNQT